MGFFEPLFEGIKTALDFLGMLLNGLISLFGMIPKAFLTVNYVVGLMPPVLTAFLVVSVTVAIVFLIIGR